MTNQRMMRWPGSEPFAMWGYREGPEEATPEWRNAELASRMMARFAKGAQPWHLEVHFVEPHDPYMPLKQYLDRYDPRAIPVPKSFGDTFAGKPGLHRRESETWGAVTEDDVRQSRAHYYAYTEQLDAQIGRVLKALDETGQADRTLVAFTTDHGDMVGAHRMWIKGWLPYEECYRVPMIVRWPGRTQAGSKTSRLVQTHDLAHTYVAAAARGPAVRRRRRAATSVRRPANTAWRDDILCAYYGGEYLYTQRIAITERFKYVFNGFDYDEMYDLERDPDEMRNVVNEAEYAKWTADMRARMYEMMARFHDPYGDAPEKRQRYRRRPLLRIALPAARQDALTDNPLFIAAEGYTPPYGLSISIQRRGLLARGVVRVAETFSFSVPGFGGPHEPIKIPSRKVKW